MTGSTPEAVSEASLYKSKALMKVEILLFCVLLMAHSSFFAEILHRFRHPGETSAAIHAKGQKKLQIQNVESRRLNAI